ncbi:PilZ domain-containing protein [Candidatus Omnitrophota bacterium]
MKRKKKYTENRGTRRFAVSLPVTYHTTIPPVKEQLKIRAQTKDISAEGLGFVGSHKPDPLVIDLQLELPRKSKRGKPTKPKTINAKVKIVYSRPVAKGHQDILSTGACFIDLRKKDARLLQKLLAGYK